MGPVEIAQKFNFHIYLNCGIQSLMGKIFDQLTDFLILLKIFLAQLCSRVIYAKLVVLMLST